jgi:hypothetical protein
MLETLDKEREREREREREIKEEWATSDKLSFIHLQTLPYCISLAGMILKTP